MNLSHQDLSDLVGEIHDCALNPGHWSATLEHIGTRLGACNGQVMSRGNGSLSFAASWGTTEEDHQTYIENYAHIDPIATMDWHFAIDEPVTVERFMPYAEYHATRVYRDFLKPRGWHDFVLTILEKSASRLTIFGFTRHERDGKFGPQELELMRLIAPHVRRAVILGGLLATASARADDLAGAFAALPTPTLLLDGDGRIQEANAAATRLLAQPGSPLRITDGRLRGNGAGGPTVQAGLGAALADPAIAASFPFNDTQGNPHIAHVLPLRDSKHPNDARANMVIFIQPVGELVPLPGEVLVKLYGLTPAETRLLGVLARGESLEATAAALGIAITTARTHLQRIFEKTGTTRQAELVRLVLSAFPAPPG